MTVQSSPSHHRLLSNAVITLSVILFKLAQNRCCVNCAILAQNGYDIVVLLDCPPESAEVGDHGARMNRICHMRGTQENR
jgi:hypothetical protein